MQPARTKRPSRLLTASLALAALSIPGIGSRGAAPQEKSLVAARSDLDFARKLASRFRYIDLAEEVLAELERDPISSELGEELDLAKCDVYAEGARREGDPAKRVELYEKAIEAYRNYIDANPYSDFLPQAERSYVDLANSYARALESQLDEALGEEAQALREKISKVLEVALERTQELIDELEGEESQLKKNERWRLMLNHGQMLLTFAKVKEDGTLFFSRAEDLLESLAFEAGERTGWGLNAYLLLGKVKAAQNEFVDAAAFSEFVVDTAIPRSEAELEAMGWSELPPDVRQRHWTLVELATADLVESYLNAGDPQTACEWALHFYNVWKREGFTLSARGYLSLLSVARALLDAGGWVGGSLNQGNLRWFATEEEMTAARFSGRRNTRTATDLALSIAQTVNQDNRGNVLQLRAQKVISEIISRPGIVVAPDVLFEAAQGEYYAKNNHDALIAFKRVLSSLEEQDDATRQEYGAKVMWHIGRCLGRLDRHLEAAMAYREGIITWKGDPEYDPKNAKGFYDSIKLARSGAGDDPVLKRLFREAEQAVINTPSGGDQSEIQKRIADRLYDQREYAEARQTYLGVTEGKVYEECMTKATLCLYKLKDYENAAREFRDYLERYVVDPKNALTDPTKIASRQKAMAQATFYLGRIAYSTKDWDQVIHWLGDLHEKYPEQSDYVPVALYMVIDAHLAAGRLDEARKAHAIQLKLAPTHKQTGSAALKLYTVLSQELAKARQAEDAARVRALEEEMAPYLRTANKLSGKPSYGNLRREAELWMNLENWSEAERVLLDTLRLFENDPARAAALDSHVRPDLGHVYLAQKRVAEAFEVLDPLVPDPRDKDDPRKVASAVARDWCRAVCGWVEGDGGEVIEVPGVGGDDNFDKATQQWTRLTGSEAIDHQWECTWYGLKFESAYAYYRWSQTDSSKKANAKRILLDLRQIADDPNFDLAGERCGDDVLVNRFRWLWRLVQ